MLVTHTHPLIPNDRKWWKKIRSLVQRRCSLRRDEADDFVQSALAKVLEGGMNCRDAGALGPFVVAVAHHCRMQLLHRAAIRRRLMEKFPIDCASGAIGDAVLPIDIQIERQQTLAAIFAALASLSAREQWLLRMRYMDEVPYAQMLSLFHASHGANIQTEEGLRSAVLHAKRRLQARLEPTAPENLA